MPSRLSALQELWLILRKDLTIELQGRVRTNATLFIALLVILLFSFAMGPQSKLLSQAAGGFFWLTILMSSTLGLGESFRIERDEFAQDSRKTENQDNEVQHPGALAAIHAGKSTRNLLAL